MTIEKRVFWFESFTKRGGSLETREEKSSCVPEKVSTDRVTDWLFALATQNNKGTGLRRGDTQ